MKRAIQFFKEQMLSTLGLTKIFQLFRNIQKDLWFQER